ncbi:hypothetical protein KO498_15730 [Lentibacter algarum]|uniref:tetratricopeptide repeat protein n=1 Tax=Lentibacter algarum TaxID=576131 RepID=UPI001C0A4B08|nr:hypothetical protein [Lentibacter algarum]MBU2983258.1 hypothetical protein [Lentibacter algarum]
MNRLARHLLSFCVTASIAVFSTVASAQEIPAKRLNDVTFNLALSECTAGDKQSCYNAMIFSPYSPPISHSDKEIAALLVRATNLCSGGNMLACGDAGKLTQIIQSYRVTADAYDFFSKACDGGDGYSCYRMGDFGFALQQTEDATPFLPYYESLKAPCDAGDHPACTNRATLNAYLADVYPEPAIWHAPLLAACKGELARACAMLSYIHSRDGQEDYFSNLGTPPGMSKSQRTRDRHAYNYAIDACKLGNPTGCWNASIALVNGEGARTNWEQEQAYLVQACRLGYPDACGEINHETYWRKSDRLSDLEAACREGDFSACLYLLERKTPAKQLLTKDYTERSLEICEMGSSVACGTGAHLIRVVLKDYPRALRYAEAGCTRNDSNACTVAGALYWVNIDGGKQYEKASTYYQKSCDLGNAQGCNAIGFFHFKGYHLKQSNTRAAHFFNIACDKNLAIACFDLASALIDTNADASRKAALKACQLAPEKYCDN